MDAKELSQILSDRAASVAQYLLPNGKKSGNEWKAGSTSGDAGQSLSIRVRGDKSGVWKDFATGESGDLLDLWMRCNGINLAEAMKEAAGWAGVELPAFKSKTFQKPKRPDGIKRTGRPIDWLMIDRKVSKEAVDAFKVVSQGDKHLMFPYLIDGVLLNYKIRNVDDKKDMRVAAGCEQLLFGWDLVDKNARSIVLCEGEIDALTMFDYGVTALSVFSGAGNLAWLENEYGRLDQFSDIVLCLDSDDAGRKGMALLVERLGMERCRIATLPKKDANECMLAGVTKEAIHLAISNAQHVSPSEIKKPSDFLGEVMHEFFPADGDELGILMPWAVMGDKVRLRSSELSIWAGYSGHGKSQLLGQVMITAAEQGDRVCIASLEMKARKTLKRLVRQCVGSDTPSQDEVRQAMAWIDSKFLIYDVVGGQTVKEVLDKFAYVRKRYGVQHFVIDNLMMLDVSAEDKDSQTKVVRELMQFKSKYDCHLHLVAHSRKGESEDKAPRKLDISGSGNIVNLADNVFIVWRNKPKEEGRKDSSEPDAIFFTDKQRDGEWEGATRLWFDRRSLQYRDRDEAGIRVHDAMRVRMTTEEPAEVEF